MSRIPRVTGSDLLAALAKAGFAVIRIKGSYHFLRHEDGRSSVVPAHSGETIGPGLLARSFATVKSTSRTFGGCCSRNRSRHAAGVWKGR
jgi:predicted RNA binding protein YcfA (HicA-like mRNA interferase family)